jgi:hypothetical protein
VALKLAAQTQIVQSPTTVEAQVNAQNATKTPTLVKMAIHANLILPVKKVNVIQVTLNLVKAIWTSFVSEEPVIKSNAPRIQNVKITLHFANQMAFATIALKNAMEMTLSLVMGSKVTVKEERA